jgi:membrane protease YdiL (CAAX protease family)
LILAVQIGVLIVYAVVLQIQTHRDPPASIVYNGNYISIAAVVTVPLVIGLVALLIYVRRRRIADYLALKAPSTRQAVTAVGGLAVLLTASDLITYLSDRPIVPEFMDRVYTTAWFPVLLLALVVAAPLNEETLFRGFLFRGIVGAWGPVAAIVISALFWAVLHVQYDLFGIASILVMGLYIGTVRHRTGSLPLTMSLHAIANAVATVEVVVKTHWMH